MQYNNFVMSTVPLTLAAYTKKNAVFVCKIPSKFHKIPIVFSVSGNNRRTQGRNENYYIIFVRKPRVIK